MISKTRFDWLANVDSVRAKAEEKAKFFTDALACEIRKNIGANDLVSEATPAPLAKIQNNYRYQVIARSPQIMRLTEAIAKVVTATKLPPDVTLAVDVDPVSLL